MTHPTRRGVIIPPRAPLEQQLDAVQEVTNGHHWVTLTFTRSTLVCCRDCGIVRRRDDRNKPCRGIVGVTPRATPHANSGVDSAAAPGVSR